MTTVKVTFNTWKVLDSEGLELGFIRQIGEQWATWAKGERLGIYPNFQDACQAIQPAIVDPLPLYGMNFKGLEID